MSRTKIVCTSTDAATPFANFEGGVVSNVTESNGVKDPKAKFVRFDAGKDKNRMANVAEVMVLHNSNVSQGLLQKQSGKPADEVKDGDVCYFSNEAKLKRDGRLAFA